MNRFLDTSALLKRYIPEVGTEAVDRILSGCSVYISSLTLTEAVSAFRRLWEVRRVMDERAFRDLRAHLLADVGRGVVEVVPLTAQDVVVSLEMLDGQYLTPINALILASAVNLRRRIADLVFVSADTKLCAAAEPLMKVVNPSHNPEQRQA
ncbi:MAG: type II toxin-antitoxin system VapC family toxin [Patescibacteria group bacterium]